MPNEPAQPQKTCKMCCMVIPEGAKKCPYCHYLQSAPVMILFHPFFAAAVMSLAMAILGWFMVKTIKTFSPGANFGSYQNQIAIVGSRVVFGETKTGRTVDVIGAITNSSPRAWTDLQFHVDFLTAAGERADVGHKLAYGLTLPAKSSTSFKVSFPMEFPETNYARHVATVLTAREARDPW